jgi:hypothetical protein
MRKILDEVAEEVVGEYARGVQSTWDELTRNYLVEKARLVPFVMMTADENWMTFRLRYVVEYNKRGTTRDALFRRLLDRIDATNGAVSIASAAQEITLMRPSAVAVELESGAAPDSAPA